MKLILGIGFDLIPGIVALLYVVGAWRSWRMGKLQWRAERPMLFWFAFITAMVVVAIMVWTSAELLLGN
jgi:hypothetical protein